MEKLKRRKPSLIEEQKPRQARKPGGGRKSKEYLELQAKILRKRNLMENFMAKAEELVHKDPAEARQCLSEVRTLKKEIEEMENPPEEKKKPTQGSDEERKPLSLQETMKRNPPGSKSIDRDEFDRWKEETIFQPKYIGKDEELVEDEKPLLKWRKRLE